MVAHQRFERCNFGAADQIALIVFFTLLFAALAALVTVTRSQGDRIAELENRAGIEHEATK